jgi:O-antigen biosynthesis protein WbqP
MYRRFLKRPLDVVLTVAALVALSPLFLLVAVAILLDDGAPVLFRQQRIGRSGIPFTLLKFRSLPKNTPQLPSAAAIAIHPTRVGRVIRRTNIDELPQLLNIVRGEMSIVGPRPALLSQQSLIELRVETGAAECLPGLTGLAQVNAYDGMPIEEKAAHDASYCRRITLRRDLVIIGRTLSYLRKRPPTY